MARATTRTAPAKSTPAPAATDPATDFGWMEAIPDATPVVYFSASAFDAERDTPERVKTIAKEAYAAYVSGDTKHRQITFASAERATIFAKVLKKYCANRTPKWTVRGGAGLEARDQDPKVVTFQVKPFEARERKV